MSKKSSTGYTKGTMKTLDAKALKARKDNLHAEFEREKAEAAKYEQVMKAAQKKRQDHIVKMSDLMAKHAEIEELERSIGIDPLSTRAETKPTNRKERRAKK